MRLVAMVRGLARSTREEIVVTSLDDGAARQLTLARWSIPGWDADVPDHVLVVDDSWASGGHAQSLAALLKQSGVRKVSIMTVARLLSPEWSENPEFVKTRLCGSTFDWAHCPGPTMVYAHSDSVRPGKRSACDSQGGRFSL